MNIRFNQPAITGNELIYIQQALETKRLAGNGEFTLRCQTLLQEKLNCFSVLLTHSCTAALEMAGLLTDVGPGDEVIMPSYTFVSTANAFALRGATPVFVDIDPETLNINPQCIEEAITSRTKVIVPVHYAGVACNMEAILRLAKQADCYVVEDAAQGVYASYQERALGSLGDLGTFSFHETKNIMSGEGGALIVNNPELADRAEIIWEKGTNRSQFFRGEVDKYTWQDIGSSYLPSELIAACLAAQLEQADVITERRLKVWHHYDRNLRPLEQSGKLRCPVVPSDCQHNAHMYYVLANSPTQQKKLLRGLKDVGIHAVFHYIPLHSAPAGRRFGKVSGSLMVTDDLYQRIVRLPVWPDMTVDQVNMVCDRVHGLL